MSRAVFAYPDRIVSEYVNVRKPRKRCQSDRRAAIVSKNEEGSTRCPENSMIPNPIHDSAHAVFANPKMDISTFWFVPSEIASVFDVVQRRTVEIRAAANEERHSFRQGLQDVASSFSRRNFGLTRELRD